ARGVRHRGGRTGQAVRGDDSGGRRHVRRATRIGAGPAGPQRRGQDDDGADDDHAHEADAGDRARRGVRRRRRPGRRAEVDGAHGSVGDGGRAADRQGEPLADRQPLRPGPLHDQADRRRAAGAVLPHRRRWARGEDLLRRDAATAGPRGQPRRHAAGAVPRRADDGAGPAQPSGALGRAARPGARRHDAAPDHAVPRGGRPARRRHRRDRPWPGHRAGDPAPAQGRVGQGVPRGDGLACRGPPGSRRARPERRSRRPRRGAGPAHHGSRRGPVRHHPHRRDLRRQRDRPGRPGPPAAQPGRRVPAPDRTPRGGHLRVEIGCHRGRGGQRM
ncbi:MAG: Efflux ABC transporter, ATP-binding protein, partial [uncultured Nocardioides sp.]